LSLTFLLPILSFKYTFDSFSFYSNSISSRMPTAFLYLLLSCRIQVSAADTVAHVRRHRTSEHAELAAAPRRL